jgi:large subunit ribosomal protein L2
MALKKLRPITPGQRFRLASSFEEVTAKAPEKSLLAPIKKSGGRNNSGKMTMRYIGGGHKKQYRVIDFKREKAGVPAVVKAIEYDPNRTARIALLYYADGEKSYILAPAGLTVGTTIISGSGIAPEVGNCLPLSEMPLGTIIHNIELMPGNGGILARSAGTYAQLVAREGRYATIKLPSGEMRMVLVNCVATVGTVSNSDHMNENKGKAGRNRWKAFVLAFVVLP